jgi:endonuclease YncB( thermonuclease family)
MTAPDMDGLFLLTRVVDGDSVDGSIHLRGWTFDGWEIAPWREDKFRLINLDTPERGQAGWAEARADLELWIRYHPNLRVRTYGRDSFGRTLADIYDLDTGDTVSQYMLRERGWQPWVPS